LQLQDGVRSVLRNTVPIMVRCADLSQGVSASMRTVLHGAAQHTAKKSLACMVLHTVLLHALQAHACSCCSMHICMIVLKPCAPVAVQPKYSFSWPVMLAVVLVTRLALHMSAPDRHSTKSSCSG
jgi:hypothetical protein